MNTTEAVETEIKKAPLIRSSVWLGNTDLEGIVGSTAKSVTSTELGSLALKASGGSVEVTCETVPVHDLAHLVILVSELPSFDLAFVSVEPGFIRDAEITISQTEANASAQLLKSTQALRSAGAHVFLVLASTLLAPISPAGSRRPESLVLHARNLAAIEVAAKTGASTIDLDRLVAEIGGRIAVTGPCQYSEQLNVSARNEVIRILEHYRLLNRDSSPVLQVSVGLESA